MNYFRFVAEEVREILASLGRAQPRGAHRPHRATSQCCAGVTPRAAQARPDADPLARRAEPRRAAVLRARPRNAPFDKGELAERMVRDMLPAIEAQVRRRVALRAEELQPLHRRAPLRRDRAPLGQLRHGRGAAHRALHRQRRARASACGTPAACTCTSKAMPTTTSARAWRRAASCCARRATPRFVAQGHGHHGQHLPVRRHRRRAVRRRPAPASASPCAIPARSPSSRAPAITAANT